MLHCKDALVKQARVIPGAPTLRLPEDTISLAKNVTFPLQNRNCFQIMFNTFGTKCTYLQQYLAIVGDSSKLKTINILPYVGIS